MKSRPIREILITATEYHRAGRLDEAAALYQKVLPVDPKNADALHLMGLLAHQRGDHAHGMSLIAKAISINPLDAIYHYHYAVVLTAAGLADEAVAAYRNAILHRPDYAEAHNNLGLELLRKGLNDEARGCFETALRLRSDFVDALLNMGNLHKNRGELDQASSFYKRVLALNPNHAGAHNNMGNLMLRRGDLDEAIVCYRRALSINPNDVDPTNNLGGALMRRGSYEEALDCFDRALGIASNHAGTHLNRAWILLLHGEYARGWPEYEWRLNFAEQDMPVIRRLAASGCPLWDGASLSGKTILVHAEQGFGDTIHFVRYLPRLKERGAKVIFCCQRELVPLMKSARGIDQLLPEPADGQISEIFDCHVPLLSLPGLIDPDLSRVSSNVPYFRPDTELVRRWGSKLAYAGFKVGIVWAGRPTNKEDWRRSCMLQDFAGLAGVNGIRIFSLQKGPASSEAQSPPPGMDLIDLGPDLCSFEETAAAIMNLDLVIAVDTAVAHLAGALARPIWTLLPFFPDWRWMLQREDCPWYPTMKLFRQPQTGDWQSVFNRVAAELNQAVQSQ